MWEHDYYPHLYFPASEIQNCTLKDKQPVKSDGIYRASVAELHVAADEGRKIPAAVTDRVVRFTEDRSLGALTGLVRLEFKAMGKGKSLSRLLPEGKNPVLSSSFFLLSFFLQKKMRRRKMQRINVLVFHCETFLVYRLTRHFPL